MVAVPGAPTPLTIPLEPTTVANAVLLLLHEPPETASLNVIVDPKQTLPGPLIVGTEVTTVTLSVVVQVVGSV